MLKKYECVEVSLNDEQHDDIRAILDKISQSEFCLNDLFVESDKHGVGQVMDLWEMDKRKNQRNLCGIKRKTMSMHANCLFMYICAASLGLLLLFIVKTLQQQELEATDGV